MSKKNNKYQELDYENKRLLKENYILDQNNMRLEEELNSARAEYTKQRFDVQLAEEKVKDLNILMRALIHAHMFLDFASRHCDTTIYGLAIKKVIDEFICKLNQCFTNNGDIVMFDEDEDEPIEL